MYAAPSTEHSNAASISVAPKPKLANESVVVAGGPDTIIVSGGTMTVHSYSAGVSSTSPNGVLATTSNVWRPSSRLLYVFGEEHSVYSPVLLGSGPPRRQ